MICSLSIKKEEKKQLDAVGIILKIEFSSDFPDRFKYVQMCVQRWVGGEEYCDASVHGF